jgi:hypothetical protein
MAKKCALSQEIINLLNIISKKKSKEMEYLRRMINKQ